MYATYSNTGNAGIFDTGQILEDGDAPGSKDGRRFLAIIDHQGVADPVRRKGLGDGSIVIGGFWAAFLDEFLSAVAMLWTNDCFGCCFFRGRSHEWFRLVVVISREFSRHVIPIILVVVIIGSSTIIPASRRTLFHQYQAKCKQAQTTHQKESVKHSVSLLFFWFRSS